MAVIKIRSLKTNDILRAIPITSSNIADFLENGYNIGIGDWIIVGRSSSWTCLSNEFKNYYEIIETEKGEDAMKTKNFTVTGMTINAGWTDDPCIKLEIDMEASEYRKMAFGTNTAVTAEKVKNMIESRLNGTIYTVPPIKKVIFNNPATIVFWEDGTKTVAKCSKDDTFSEYAGLSMCITKKLLGRNFKKEMNRWCNKPDTVEKKSSDSIDFSKALDAADNAFRMLRASLYNDRLREEASEPFNVLCNILNDLTKNYKSAK